MGCTLTSDEDIVGVDQDLSCFLAERKGSERNPRNDEVGLVDTRLLDSADQLKNQLKLLREIGPSAITHDGLVREQNSEEFCREICITFNKGLKAATD